MVAGATTLPQRLDIFRPSGPLTMPWVTSRITGSSAGTRPRIFIHRLQNRKKGRGITGWSGRRTWMSPGGRGSAGAGRPAAGGGGGGGRGGGTRRGGGGGRSRDPRVGR